MKPDWKDAPEWARWLAMDEDGEWCWYENQPETTRLLPWWQNNRSGGLFERCEMSNRIGWRETLESRPKAA